MKPMRHKSVSKCLRIVTAKTKQETHVRASANSTKPFATLLRSPFASTQVLVVLLSKAVRAIVSSNSVDYVNRVFDAYNNGQVVMTVRSVDDRDRLDACPPDSIVHCDTQRGWSGPVPKLNPANTGPAHIQFSSGTEGQPKAIVLSHRALSNTTDRLHVLSDVSSEIREYVAGAVTHSFGLARCRLISRVGGQYFLPENGLDPAELAEMIENREINAISAVPTQWRVLLRHPALIGPVGDHIRWIEIGSQYMTAEEKIAVKQLFPNANIVQHYGLTEASRSTFLKIHDTAGEELESVGRAIGRAEFRIESDGAISVKGPHLADGILKDGKIESLTDADGWLRTSDSGREIDGDLYYLGRRDDLINCGGLKYAPEQIERHLAPALETLSPGIDFAVCKTAEEIRGEVPLIAWKQSPGLDRAPRTAKCNAPRSRHNTHRRSAPPLTDRRVTTSSA